MGSTAPLPRFREPPVIETVIGVEFAPLAKWDIPYFGLYWSEVKAEYPNFKVLPALDSQVEVFDKDVSKESEIHLVDKPPLRCWFMAEDDSTLIQIQSTRMIFNWKRGTRDEVYPHFEETIRPAFVREWSRFRKFVNDRALGNLAIVQAEVTYVNHLEVGKGWSSAADIGNVFPAWVGRTSGSFLPSPEGVAFEARYLIPDRAGRLRISVRPAIRNSDGVEIIQMNVSARGGPRGSDDGSLIDWIDKGREWVVRGFADFTSVAMHGIWKRSQ